MLLSSARTPQKHTRGFMETQHHSSLRTTKAVYLGMWAVSSLGLLSADPDGEKVEELLSDPLKYIYSIG